MQSSYLPSFHVLNGKIAQKCLQQISVKYYNTLMDTAPASKMKAWAVVTGRRGLTSKFF